MATIKVTWVLLGFLEDYRAERLPLYRAEHPDAKEEVSAEFEFEIGEAEDKTICEQVFADTNRYEGAIWEAMREVMPAERSHTALSVGDKVSIDGRTYRCEPIGFALVA